MKRFIFRILSLCFPVHKFDSSWRTTLSLTILQPPQRHRRIRKLLDADFPLPGQHDPLLAWTVSLGILGIGVVLIRLLF